MQKSILFLSHFFYIIFILYNFSENYTWKERFCWNI